MNHTTTLFGIPNCDSVKKARDWLSEHDVSYTFHDFKKQGVPIDLLPDWIKAVGLDKLINAASATAVILANSSVIKRPLVVWADGVITVGFDVNMFAQRLIKI